VRRMKTLLAILLTLTATPVAATSTICRFSAPVDAGDYDLEFLGYGEIAQILFHVPGQGYPSSLPGDSYEIHDFDRSSARVHIVYRNPGDKRLFPSFTLKGSGNSVRMSVAGQEFVGEFRCDF
ncbi:hypothetical protein ACW5F0_14725, partial [Luteimonas sp. A534]